MGFNNFRLHLQIPGVASPFRLRAGSDVTFVIRCSYPDSLKLYALAIKKKKRDAVVSGAKIFTRSGPELERPYGLRFALSEYEDSSFKIVVRSPEPGEYAFTFGVAVFDFGVDTQ